MLFIDQLDRITSEYPDKVAIVDKEKSITFSELRARAISLASEIHKIHPQTKRPITVETDRLLETIISFFAVLYSGN
ncbi:MAG: AMP-binding protein, partial [Fenollaria timonensis]